MTDAPRPRPAKQREQAARDERLARALRDNLRRRKEQRRARVPAAAPRDDTPAGGGPGGGRPA